MKERRGPGAVDLVEEAMQVLIAMPSADWLAYLAGALPMLCGAMLFWFVMVDPRFPHGWTVPAAAVMTALYIGFNVARAVFAGKVRRQLSGAPNPPWTAARVRRLVLVQIRVAMMRLWLVPCAAMALFPCAWVVAWLRNITALNDTTHGSDWPALRREASRQASLWMLQSWQLLALFGFVWFVLLANIVLAMVTVPLLLKSLTGQESWMSRLGGFLLMHAGTWFTAIGVAWIAVDPLIQASYAVRCFHGESMRTGEDLLARLRRLRAGALAAVLLLALAAGPVMAARPAPPPVTGTQIDRAIQQTLRSPEYAWMTRPAANAQRAMPGWLERMMRSINNAVEWLGQQIQSFFDWLRKLFQFENDRTKQPPFPGSRALDWVIGSAVALLTAAAVFLLLRRRRAKPKTAVAAAGAGAVDIHDETVGAERLPEQEWLDLALRLEAEGDRRGSLRALYLANLAWLAQESFVTLDRAKTNGEYRREVRRRTRRLPELAVAFDANAREFDAVWYGLHEATDDTLAAFRERSERMKAPEVAA